MNAAVLSIAQRPVFRLPRSLAQALAAPLHALAGMAQRDRQASERRRARAAMRELSGLGQHQLNDLGVGRSELDYWADAAPQQPRG